MWRHFNTTGHIILEHISAHKTKFAAAFLDKHRDIALHFTSIDGSCLNQVEIWFSKVPRDIIARGVFTSTAERARKLRRNINA